jgi:hypothetical protein
MDRKRAVIVAGCATAVVLSTAWAAGWLERLGEPEVVHDINGGAWYRIRGEDNFQRAVEACYALQQRTVVPGAIVPGAPSEDNQTVFCCGRRASPESGVNCDKPRGTRWSW